VVVLLVVSAVSALPSSKIIGGEASIEEFPSQASFFVYGSLVCGASILSEKVVVTAAHCILNRIYPQDCDVRVGSALYDEGGQLINVEQIYMHEKYRTDMRYYYDYDVALLLLRTNIVFNGITVAPIQFAQSGEPLLSGVVGLVAGWSSGYEAHKELRKVSLSVNELEKCRDIYADNDSKVTERMLCAQVDEENATCATDGGSPMIVDGVLVGIASWVKECGNPLYPSVFTDVSTVSDWISKTLVAIA